MLSLSHKQDVAPSPYLQQSRKTVTKQFWSDAEELEGSIHSSYQNPR